MKYLNLIVLFCFFLPQGLSSQSLKCDSVVLSLSGYRSGNIQWQISSNGSDWNNLSGANSASVTVLGNHDKYYRAIVNEGTCDPYYTDTLFDIQPYPLTQTEVDSIYNGSITTMFRVRNIYLQPDSITLRTPSLNIALCDTGEIFRLYNRMYKTVRNPARPGVGIAAPQIGINRRAMYVQRYDKLPANNRPFEFYLNARIVAYSDTVALRPDGCLSVPTGTSWPSQIDSTYRAIWIVVEYNKVDGTFVRERINHQFTAHIFQHEIDHLEAIMYFDRAGSKKVRAVVSGTKKSE